MPSRSRSPRRVRRPCSPDGSSTGPPHGRSWPPPGDIVVPGGSRPEVQSRVAHLHNGSSPGFRAADFLRAGSPGMAECLHSAGHGPLRVRCGADVERGSSPALDSADGRGCGSGSPSPPRCSSPPVVRLPPRPPQDLSPTRCRSPRRPPRQRLPRSTRSTPRRATPSTVLSDGPRRPPPLFLEAGAWCPVTSSCG